MFPKPLEISLLRHDWLLGKRDNCVNMSQQFTSSELFWRSDLDNLSKRIQASDDLGRPKSHIQGLASRWAKPDSIYLQPVDDRRILEKLRSHK
jgi:hypothetical protein